MESRLTFVVAALVSLAAALGAAAPLAQGPAECTSVDCAPRGNAGPGVAPPVLQQVWQEAGELHQLKLRFVAALQRVTRAQSGTVGDEAGELAAGVAAMRTALTEWDARLAQFDAVTARLAPSAELRVARGTVLLDRHRVADALRELSEAARLDADRADVPALQALAFGAAGKPADAQRALRRATARDPGNVVLAYGLAQRAVGLQQQDEAARALARVAELLKTASAASSGLVAPPAPFERLALLGQAAGVAPIFPLAIYANAYVLLASGELPAALTAFDAALRVDPMNRPAQPARDAIARAGALLRAGAVPDARATLEAVVQQAPDEAEVHRALALALWAADAYEPAIGHASTAVRLEPGNERARLLLADLMTAAERLSDARQALEDAVRVVPGSGAAQYRLGQLHRSEARLPDALAAFVASARAAPVVGQDHLYFTIGSSSVDQADFDGAVAAYATRLDVNPNNAEAHRQLGEVYFLQGRDVEALAEHSVAAWLAPAAARAHAGRGHALLRLQQPAAAATAFERAVALGEDQAEVLYGLGTALMRAGKKAEGVQQLEASQRRRADDLARGQRDFQIDALRRAAAEERAAGRHLQVVSLLGDALALDPSSPRGRRDLGAALLAAGRAAAAAPQLDVAQRADPTTDGARLLAEAYTAAGNRAASEAATAEHATLAARDARDRLARLTGGPSSP